MLRWLGYLFGLGLLGSLIAAGGAIWVFWEFGRDLPDYRQLANYSPPVTTRVHAGDGSLLAEYAVERRVFVPVSTMPKQVINAFLSAEDQNFYRHPGVDMIGVARAVVTNVKNYGKGRRPVGASTITQQVAQNFLLTKDVSITRKIREAIISFRMERVFTKDEILELYLNQIYLGFGSYGIAAAASNYFDKSLDELTVEEAAFLAALPKAPNNYNPLRYYDAAVERRNYVLGRMVEDGYIPPIEGDIARSAAINVARTDGAARISAPYFAEEVRRELAERYGDNALYQGGLSVRTTLDPRLQRIAQRELRDGLITYDRRHGWRGPVHAFEAMDSWAQRLTEVVVPAGSGEWRLAVVLTVDDQKKEALIGFDDGQKGQIPLAEVKWARQWLEGQKRGPSVKKVSQVLNVADVILVEAVTEDSEGEPYPENSFGLRQIPDVNGSIVAIDPHTGRVLAMSGGLDFAESEFNRATQAWRQPGSAFKPFVYLAALDNGFTPSSLVLDAPFVIDQGPGLGKWKPANYTNKFYGPSPMRLGIEKSRNLMTVRLAQTVGMEQVAQYAERLGVMDNIPRQLSMSIGAGETTLLRLVTAYAMIANGGKQVTPTLIDRIQDRKGNTVFNHDARPCEDCRNLEWDGQAPPQPPDLRAELLDSGTAYQMVSMLQGVVQRGTGVRIRAVGKPLAGKTGTTNDSLDTWFVGFSPDLAVGVFVGFDEPKPLGPKETGSSVTAPIFRDFMAAALEDQPAIPFRVPSGIRLVRVNASTGVVAQRGEKRVILEAFKPGTEPTELGAVVDGGYRPDGAARGSRQRTAKPTRGIY
ncbi:MAG: PBP1A family penicillin-binding protein [Alphaproteobacteria bacterium]|nr:PBP1A family penicillin-binding protein [Alphaproteobacteria bacterium]